MTQTMKTVPVAELEIGKAYNVVRATNAAGQPMRNIRRGDWRAVLLTKDSLTSYTSGENGTNYFQPLRDRLAPALLAAGWTRFSSSRGECGMEIVTRGPLFGLACVKPALWARGGCIPMCAQHATLA